MREATEALDHAEAAVKDLEKLPKKLWEAPREEQLADLDRVASVLTRG